MDRHIKQYMQHTGTFKDGTHYKRISHLLVDVFTGMGFSRPTRLMKQNQKWVHLWGPRLSADIIGQLPA
jgi:hypothetical protein